MSADYPHPPELDPWADPPEEVSHPPTPEEIRAAELADVASLMVGGGSFLLDIPDAVPAIWGSEDDVLWAEGEALTLCGTPGVGKTTLAGQLVRARILGGYVLGLRVRKGRRVLYLAMDRPKQIARALRRTLGDIDRETLDASLVVWKGPPLKDIARHPKLLLTLAEAADADTIVVDSLKDAAIGLTDDEVGAGYNRARQYCTASGVEVLELHHMVKRGANGAPPTTLADLYGSVWISSGSGSVVLLHGNAGDPLVEFRQLKPVVAEVGPWRIAHDHEAGVSTIAHEVDLLVLAKHSKAAGITAKDAAGAIWGSNPSPADIQRARRRLEKLARSGELVEVPGSVGGATKQPTSWKVP